MNMGHPQLMSNTCIRPVYLKQENVTCYGYLPLFAVPPDVKKILESMLSCNIELICMHDTLDFHFRRPLPH